MTIELLHCKLSIAFFAYLYPPFGSLTSVLSCWSLLDTIYDFWKATTLPWITLLHKHKFTANSHYRPCFCYWHRHNPSLYLEQSPNVSSLIKNEYFFYLFQKTIVITFTTVIFLDWAWIILFSWKLTELPSGERLRKSECSHRVCVDGIKKSFFQ